MSKHILIIANRLCFIGFFLAQSLFAQQVFYVGNSSEISSAMQQASPGDTLIMANGKWENERIVFSGNGQEGSPITLKAETPGQVIITGSSNLRISGDYLVVEGLYFVDGRSPSGAVIEFRNGSSNQSRYSRLTNTAIVNFNPSSNSQDYKWVSLYGEYNRVDHCYLKGKSHSGTTLVVWLDGEPNYHRIDSNYFAYRPELGVNGGETIRVGTSDYSMTDSYTTVEYNYFEQCNGEIEIISNKSGHNTFRYNTFYESEGALTCRHGNFAEIYGNFFLGNNKSNTGGVRIIGEDHKVYNNYFENLKGTSFRSALTIMNGVPNSPLNRYFQVKRAQVINNTFVNCEETFRIAAGADSERTLPPEDCIIANNVVVSNYQIIDYDDEPINLVYDSNIMFGGPLGIDEVEGIELIDPMLTEEQNDIFRFSTSSPLYNAGSVNYSFVTNDIDGQARDSQPDIGADEISADNITNRPLTPGDIGTSWEIYEIDPPRVIFVNAGQDSLISALNQAQPKDTLELVTEGGIYSISESIKITSEIYIRAASGLTAKPVITASDELNTLIELDEGASLYLYDIELDGKANTSSNVKYLIRTVDSPINGSYSLYVNGCYLHDVAIGSDGNFFRAYEGTFADNIVFSNSILANSGKEGIRLIDEASNSSKYNVDYFEISNSTIYNTTREAVTIYGGDKVIYTPGPEVVINQVTFYNCGYEGKPAIDLRDCDNSTINNSIISGNGTNDVAVKLFSELSQIRNSIVFNPDSIFAEGKVKIGPKVFSLDPLFINPGEGDFTLDASSAALTLSSSGGAIGDLRWAVNEPSYYTLSIVIYGSGSVVTDPSSEVGNYEPGTLVMLTAVPDENYEFVQWSGGATGTESSVQVEMTESKLVTAVFQQVTSVNDIDIPQRFNLAQNYPNPFNPSTRIRYELAEYGFISIKIYDVQGRLVQTLVNSEKPAGYYELNWNASGLSSGIYFLNMTAGNNFFSKKLILLK